MAEERKKMYFKKGTGTVPKVKYTRKCRNMVACVNQGDAHRNNLDLDGQEEFPRNHIPHNCYLMDAPLVDNQESLSCLDKIPHSNINGNGASSSNTSGSVSRRNSLGTVPKCDNITKYPDQRHIEEKLNKIQEYLRVTNSLMSSMKNADDQNIDQSERESLSQMANDLKDSENKLILLLAKISNENEPESDEPKKENGTELMENVSESDAAVACKKKNICNQKDDHTNHEILLIPNQQNALLSLQHKAENKLRQARIAQDKLTRPSNKIKPKSEQSSSYDIEDNDYASSNSSMKFVENHFDLSMKELEEQIKNFKLLRQAQDSVKQKIDELDYSNDAREHFIDHLDNRDTLLQTEQSALENKLVDLQNKKMQVDRLVHQIQNLQEEADSEDVAAQVTKIVTMKQQLAKLKDMLEIVKTSESFLESQNVNDSDFEEAIHSIGSKTALIQKNDVKSGRAMSSKSLSNLDNNSRWSCEKQINKSSLERENGTGAKPKIPSNQEKLRLQAELQAKKRELEEIMCKHKAGTSNLNHDIGSENKSDFGSASNSFFESVSTSWYPIPTSLPHSRKIFSDDQYSSDDCPEEDINDFSELNSSANMSHSQPRASSEYSNYGKGRDVPVPQLEVNQMPNQDYNRFRSFEKGLHGNQNQSTLTNERCRSNNEQKMQNKSQTQKQLELIRSVCDSMLESQQNNNNNAQQTNVQHLRNNLTPSPLYSEPRQYASPNPHAMNQLNVLNPNENPWGMPGGLGTLRYPADINGYQNMLATNTLQTQAFMLNTLNHCCQMLWLQQRELTALRNTVSLMQENFDQNPSYTNSHPPFVCPTISTSSPFGPTDPKMNHISSACSLPNLNQNNTLQANNDLAYVGQNNDHSGRLIDSGLNNTVPPNHRSVGINNSLLHNTNNPVGQNLPSQIWNGQALNNQVAPGNRANNYWDNFRSYSRQNLLSTKSNETLQNNSAHLYSFSPSSATNPKLNVSQGTTNFSEDVQSGSQTKSRRVRNAGSAPPVPPDVLNVNQESPKLDGNELAEDMFSFEDEFNFRPLNFSEISSNHSNVSDGEQQHFKESGCESRRNRNEWHKQTQNDPESKKSKLFEELRENVYREVATLISANEGRPHFLIQLFRDLQLISSDPLRRQTLRSIHALITNSLTTNLQGAPQQVTNSNNTINNAAVIPDNQENVEFCLWPQMTKSSAHPTANSLSLNNFQEYETISADQLAALDYIVVFLNLHSEETLQTNLMESLKELLILSDSFQKLMASFHLKNKTCRKKISALLTETLDQFKGKKICDIKVQLLQTVVDLFRTEVAVVQVEESLSEFSSDVVANNETASNSLNEIHSEVNHQRSVFVDENNPPQIQNGDLAEADQSRPEVVEEDDEDDEEEGAVGGILNERTINKNTEQLDGDDAVLTKIDVTAVKVECETEFSEQGLDQVPTRLTTYSKSRSNTPNRDFPISKTEPPDHY